ncbi:autotransporter outer membrane beta-barrel domain-containing protein [Pseudomonas sp. B329]|uniref:autotransporter outer membrane beta-barrel domain-containing protein n=1 Tax=Pseudomonas sp. B329 TaxID=1553459 RepID=UPI0020043A7C
MSKEAIAANFIANPNGHVFTTNGSGTVVSTQGSEQVAAVKGYVSASTTGETIDVAQKGVNNATGSSGNDALQGDAQTNWLAGGQGSDTFYGGAWHEIDSKRDVAHKNGSTRLKGNYDGSTRQAFAELSHNIHFNTVTLEPFIGLNYVHVETKAFSEKENLFALSGKKSRMDVTSARLGARVSAVHPLANGMAVRLNGSAGLQHAFTEKTTHTRLKLQSQGDFVNISGLPVQQDTAQLAFSATLDLTPAFSVGLRYTGEIGKRFHDESTSAIASWTF